MANPTKIFELKGEDFAKGLSYRSGFPIGGNLRSASGFDPFENYGYFTPALSTANVSDTTETPTILTSWNTGGSAYIYAHTPTSLYQILDGSPYTQVDKSAEITVTNPVAGAIIYKNKYIYQDNAGGIVRSNSLPVASGNDTTILSSAFATTEYYHPFGVGADRNLYVADFGQIHQISNVIGTSGNVVGVFDVESGMMVRDILSDGRYLVIITDNNLSNKIGSTGNEGNYRCQVYFWDMIKATADIIYEFTDSYLIGAKYLDGAVYIFGKNNFWVCNSATPPRNIFNFDVGATITEPPTNPFQISVKDNSIFWCGQTNGTIYAYGSQFTGTRKIFYTPFAAGSTPSALTNNGTNFYIGTSGANQMVRISDTGSIRSGSLTTTSVILPQPYKFSFAKIIMKAPLTSGGSVSFQMSTLDGNAEVSSTETKTFSTFGAKQSLIFTKTSTGALKDVFNDFRLTVSANQTIAKIEVWGTPVDSYEQTT